MASNQFLDEIFMGSDKKKDKVAIFMHRTPDPDSLGSALCIQFILTHCYGLQSVIFLDGEVSHTQNQTMVNILSIPLSPIEDYKPEKFKFTVIVDATTHNVPIDTATLVIDHHRIKEENAENILIEEVGSCCTLIWDLAKDILIEKDEDLSIQTAVLFGIISDTDTLITPNTTAKDYSAFQDLIDRVDKKKLSTFRDFPLPAYYFELEKVMAVENNNKEVESCFIGGLGVITESKRDVLAMLAEKMVRKQGIDTSVIFAIVGERLSVSIRSKHQSREMKTFAQAVCGKDFAGGKFGQGGGSIPLGVFFEASYPAEVKDKCWNYIKEAMFYRISELVSDGEL